MVGESPDDLYDDDQSLAGYILCKVKDIAKDLGLNNSYRLFAILTTQIINHEIYKADLLLDMMGRFGFLVK